jgi:hypothetical protein
MIAGAALFMGGFYIGWKFKPTQAAPEEKKQDISPEAQEDIDRVLDMQRQLANLYSYTGRKQG